MEKKPTATKISKFETDFSKCVVSLENLKSKPPIKPQKDSYLKRLISYLGKYKERRHTAYDPQFYRLSAFHFNIWSNQMQFTIMIMMIMIN